MTAAIAERILACESDSGKQLTIKLGAPRSGSDGLNYECPYQITGPGVSVERYAVGLDAIQAIQLAFVAIGAHLSVIEDAWGARLAWEGGDTGFPRPE